MLAELAQGGIYAFLLIFVLVGSAMTVMPAFSEPFINMRTRLSLALATTLAITPTLIDILPPLPESTLFLLLFILGEAFVGFFLGIVARCVMTALQTAGMVLAMTVGLANALTQDITAAEQGSIMGALRSTMGLLVILSLNLHHLLLMALIDSYTLFVPGTVPMVEDMAQHLTRVVAGSFDLGIRLSAPFLALAVVLYVGLGIINRLMASIQIFFIAIPLQIMAGLVMMMFAIPIMYQWFVQAFEGRISAFVLP